MPDTALGPTLEAPDADPWLWLEDIDSPRALAWVRAQNTSTEASFATPEVADDQDSLAEILDRPDNIPHVTRRGGYLYNFWRDATHVRGLWRRTTLDSFRAPAPVWEPVLDIDALAAAEGQDWLFHGATVLAGSWDRAMLHLSRGGGDAVELREFDLIAKDFVQHGFRLPEAKGGVDWIDADTLLLASAFGQAGATSSGYASTVRLWRRGTDPLQAPVIFATAPENMAVGASFDRENQDVVIFDRTDFITGTLYLAPWRDGAVGPRTRIDLPGDAWYSWHRGWLALRPRQDFATGGVTHPAGSVIGIARDAFLAGDDNWTRLFTPGARRAVSGSFWAAGRLVIGVLDDLRPVYRILTPGSWTQAVLPGLPALGVVGMRPLDEDAEESDGTLLAATQDPLTPASLLLTDVALSSPVVLKSAPIAFDATGLVVTRHEATAQDGTKIPYFQTGPAELTGEAPVHIYGYGGFNVPELPYYRSAIGKLWLERGGTAVTTCLRGGGEFGPAWHEAGRRAGKSRSHDDFAAVAADLVARGVTRPGRIAAEGGSNGGILITNMLTRYPERFGGLFCTIPLVDMRRYHKLLAGASWIAEYGNPDVAEDWDFIRHFSAYHNVTRGQGGPPILLATTRRDDRVHPGHARKMAAKLQALGHDAYFFELEAGGHSYGKTNRERAFFTALGLRFLRRAIGWHDDD